MTHEEYHDVLDEYYNNFSNASDKELISAEYRAKNMRNEWRWFSVRGKVFRRNEKGSVTHIVNVIEDITERKKSEADIAGLNKALTKSNRELRSTHEELQLFTNVAASNYGEILRSLYIHLEFIVNHDARNLSNTGRANLRRAQSAIHKMRLQTDDLLSLSRLHQVGDRELHVNLNSIIDRTIQEMTTKQDNPGISIDIDPLPVIPGYPSLLAVLFYQLIDNAIKFRRDDFDHRINIRSRIVRGEDIAFENEQKDQEYQIISISDNGIGFPGEEAEKIFGMFYRLHDKSEFRGSGVGLAISRKIMEIHGGFIVADGTPGNGSRFDCYFPTSTGGGED